MDQRLWQILSATNEWVRYSDGKAVALLGIQGVLIGLTVVFLKDLTSDDSTLVSKIFLLAGLVSITLSMLFTFLCLTPRLKSAGKIKVSPIYFGSIATHFQDSNAYIKFLKENFNTEDKIADALAEQVYINAGIANTKFRWVSWSTKLLVLGLVFLAVFIVLTL